MLDACHDRNQQLSLAGPYPFLPTVTPEWEGALLASTSDTGAHGCV